MSFGQPSPQGIASLYRGNPEKLDARIKQEQKAKPGMPPDMAKLLALQINTNEEDAVKRNQALAALQGMQQQAPTGTPPTVAEILAQQAEQKAQQAAAAGPQAGGLQALMGQAGPEQAQERQGSIDELQSNLGQEYAGGGIVAFSGTGSSQFVKDLAALPDEFDAMKERAREEDAVKAAQDRRMAQRKQEMLEAKQKTSLFNYLFGSPEREKEGLAKLSELSNAPLSAAAAPTAAPAASDSETKKLMGLAASRAQTGQNTNPALRPTAANAPEATQRSKPSAPAPQVETAAPAKPAALSDYEKYISDALARSPVTVRAEALARRKAELGDIDTSAQDAYIKALQGRMGGLEEPTDMYDRARAHLRRLATAGGRTWQETGANASAAMQNERLANEQKKYDLLKEIMGESTKVADLKRGEKEKAFTFAEKEYDETYKRAYEAAKEMGLNVRERERFAHQSAENALNRKSNEKIANIRADVAGGGANSEDKQKLNELKALQASKTGQLKNAYGSDKKRLQNELAAIEAEIAKMAGLSTMSAAPGAAGPGGTRPPLSSFQR